MPVLGDIVRFTIVERFCRILGSMLTAGVPVPDADGGRGRQHQQRGLPRGDSRRAREADARAARAWPRPLSATGLFPGGVCQMIRVGEETGTLDHQLEIAANFYASELDYKLKRLTALFEPPSSSSWA